jgi:hypothetical protein
VLVSAQLLLLLGLCHTSSTVAKQRVANDGLFTPPYVSAQRISFPQFAVAATYLFCSSVADSFEPRAT